MEAIRTFYGARSRVTAKIAVEMDHQIHVSDSVDRVIHIPLTEAEWQAFLKTTPQPVAWLRERIREAIARGPQAAPKDA
jgi:NAD(P)H-dependent FMN reductase